MGTRQREQAAAIQFEAAGPMKELEMVRHYLAQIGCKKSRIPATGRPEICRIFRPFVLLFNSSIFDECINKRWFCPVSLKSEDQNLKTDIVCEEGRSESKNVYSLN
jgi:hypothetical protein